MKIYSFFMAKLQWTIVNVGAVNLTHEEFHSTVAPTVISSVGCVGSESELTDCPYSALTICDPLSDAGVVCQGMYVYIYIYVCIIYYATAKLY